PPPHSPPFPYTTLFRSSRMSRESIRRSDAKAQKMLLALRLAEFRKAMKLDQSSVKGFSHPAVSKIEARGDIKLSTLVEYCHGLGDRKSTRLNSSHVSIS